MNAPTAYEITSFGYFWESSHQDFSGITKEQAQPIFLAAQRLLRNKLLCKAQELLTRPSLHPTKAVLEGIQYAGMSIPTHTFEAMQENSKRQFEETFPELAKKASPQNQS